MISISAAKKQLEAFDIIDAIVETFTWVAETGWQVFKTGSITPLLYSDQNMANYNEDFDWVVAHASAALAGNVDDLSDFENKLNRALKRTSFLQKAKPAAPTAIWLQNRYVELIRIQERLICKRKNTMMRFQPIGFSLHGGTGVGKTTLGKLTMNTSLTAMGFSTARDKQLTHDQFDAYQSTYTSDIEGIFLDDLANLKADYATGTQIPSATIIKFFNNVAAQAVKAELAEKGVVFINFKCGVVTTNKKDLDARTYSNCPESILRRLHHVHVQVKPEYRRNGGSSLDVHHPDIRVASVTKDVWLIDVEESVSTQDPTTGKTASVFKILTVKMPDGSFIHCKDINLEQYLRVVVVLSQQHQQHQKNLIKSNDDFEQVLYCSHSLPHEICSQCRNLSFAEVNAERELHLMVQAQAKAALMQVEEERQKAVIKQKQMEPESLELIHKVIVGSLRTAATNYFNSWFKPVSLLNSLLGFSPIRKMTEKTITREFERSIDDFATPLVIAMTPQFVFKTKSFQRFAECWRGAAAARDLKKHAFALSFSTLGLLGYSVFTRKPRLAFAAAGCGWLGTAGLWSSWIARKQQYEEHYLASRNALTNHVALIREKISPTTALCGATLILGVKLVCMWNEHRKITMPNSDGDMSPEDVDKQPGWFGFMMTRMGLKATTQPVSQSASTEQVLKSLEKNLMHAIITRGDGTMTNCNVFFPRKSVAWLPRHILYPDADMTGTPTGKISVLVSRHNDPGGKFTFKADPYAWHEMPDLDMIAIYVPNCPDLKCMLKWLPLTLEDGITMAMIKKRMKDLTFQQERINVTVSKVGHKYLSFRGGSYKSNLTGPGACMAPVVSDTKNPFILGFHAGGSATNGGIMQIVTRSMAETSFEHLEKMPGIALSANEGILPESQYGRPLITGPMHPKAHPSTYDANNYIDVLGACKVRRTKTSDVQDSILTDAIAEEFGVINVWGPPKMTPNWKPFNVALDNISDPAEMFYPAQLHKAREDYMAPLRPLMKAHAKREDFRPLNEHEMVCGVDGKRFLDAIPMDTSMGFPLFGKKLPFFEEVREGERLITRHIGPEVREEMDRLLSCWMQGERGYPVMSACLKDEPTKLTKDKVRVFMACPVAFGLYIRKFFLPVARFFGLHPIQSEMAVGVNAFGPQWQSLLEYMRKYEDQDGGLIGMDYKAFDTRMNSQMTRDSLVMMIELAKIGGYSAEDINIMKMMIVDLTHPVIEYNGTFIVSYNMNTSGNNITVQLNCGGNSKYVRVAVFDAVPELTDFRKAVALGTYGDDNSGSVAKPYRDRVNFLAIQTFLKKHGILITPPDKEAEGSAFFEDAELDFLKRQSVYIPEINRLIGALDEMSIFKSLHANISSKSATKQEVAVSCIEGAMHEWFGHGREVYDDRAKHMKAVCAKMGLPVPAVEITFDERVALWKEKYENDSESR